MPFFSLAQKKAIDTVHGYIAEDGDSHGETKRALWGRLRIDQTNDDEVVRTWIIGQAEDGRCSITWTS